MISSGGLEWGQQSRIIESSGICGTNLLIVTSWRRNVFIYRLKTNFFPLVKPFERKKYLSEMFFPQMLLEVERKWILFSNNNFHKEKKICFNLSNRRYYLAVKNHRTYMTEQIQVIIQNYLPFQWKKQMPSRVLNYF